MRRPSILVAVSLSLVTISIVVLGLYAFMVTGMDRLNARTADVADGWLPRSKLSAQVKIALDDLRIAYGQHAVEANVQRMNELARMSQVREADLRDALKAYEERISSDVERAAFAPIPPLVDSFVEKGGYMLEMSSGKSKDLAGYLFGHGMTELAKNINASLDKLIAFSEEGAHASKTDGVETFRSVQSGSLLALGIALTILAGVTAYVIRGVARPVKLITGSMSRLAGGNTQASVPFSDRSDEIGLMAAAVEVFRKEAIEKTALEKQADRDRKEAEASRERLTHEAEIAAMSRLQQAIAGIADGLHAVSHGNLQMRLTQPLSPEFDKLRVDLNAAAEQLSATLNTVNSAAHSILSRSTEIADSTAALSNRTEEQAAALVETTASINQIASTMGYSVKRLDDARLVAKTANESATKSGCIVAETIEAMEKIEHSSGQISSITQVINEIAFQTSLLALNAGVEAARAGDAGKGFAVVAQEVRALATRSAEAAKEINSLIETSSTQVKAGVELVHKTGATLGTIVSHISSMNDSMEGIASATVEQATTLSEVTHAINQLDRFTQQNTAMVEETSAASYELAAEARVLQNLMAAFELSEPHGAEAIFRQPQRARVA
ncbi:HAMP domain-containing methyl-accepting chemotaxis protein [Agrobacterium rosae]|uniref:HAMP domain-containing methyl-accepting chemotaxis protein n=1 Tax=Agrobacterium rosae TaxID=1972867 RepID=UPI0020344CA8|nr:methyl-accepting chemotaxis protein [Agrobacterium rosae]MCM2435931.1 HAMP domain-containing protein [Agrobacterium rosae]